jgi:inosine-uridine nucleoside N-ribohydrolase
MIKRLFKTIIILILVVFVSYIIVSNIAFFQGEGGSYNIKTIIDADSGNEMDVLYAVTRALTDHNIEIIGLISGHWNFHENAPDSSVMVSQEINEEILEILNLTHIHHPPGANEMLHYNENPVAQPSEGAKFIIENANGMASGQKLMVITLGATTNLASAILMDSSIIPKLDCYIMGLKYDPFKRAWNKNEFNARNDLDAMDIILNAKDLDLTVMTATVAGELKFQKKETFEKLRDKGNIWNWLLQNWENNWPENQEWIMQDVALIEAILHPKFATLKEIYTPPENTRRKIRIYTKIKTEAMIKDYWKAAEENSGY